MGRLSEHTALLSKSCVPMLILGMMIGRFGYLWLSLRITLPLVPLPHSHLSRLTMATSLAHLSRLAHVFLRFPCILPHDLILLLKALPDTSWRSTALCSSRLPLRRNTNGCSQTSPAVMSSSVLGAKFGFPPRTCTLWDSPRRNSGIVGLAPLRSLT